MNHVSFKCGELPLFWKMAKSMSPSGKYVFNGTEPYVKAFTCKYSVTALDQVAWASRVAIEHKVLDKLSLWALKLPAQ